MTRPWYWLSITAALLLCLAGPGLAQGGDDVDDEDDVPVIEDPMEGEEYIPEYYNDGIDSAWDPNWDPIEASEGAYIWGMRADQGSWLAFVVDLLNDDLDPAYGFEEYWPGEEPLEPQDPFAGGRGADVRERLEDEQFSPLRRVIEDGPVEGIEVPLMVLVPDTVLAEARETKGIPNVAILKAMRTADQLSNGLAFTYIKRNDLVAFQPAAQSVVPQLQYQDVRVFEGVVQFHFHMGMTPGQYANRRRGEPVTGRATVASISIADGFDRAKEQALQQAVRRAIGQRAQGSSTPLPDQVTGRIEFWEITNEGYLDGEFTVEVNAWVTVELPQGAGAPRASDPAPALGPVVPADGDDWDWD